MTISTTTHISDGHGNKGYKSAKRALDISLVAVLAIPALFVVLIAVVFIRADTRGPALFRQRRVGRNARPFICYKLRTMELGTPQAASHEISHAQVTRVGAFLRKLKIDELPQLWNVLVGDMSLVGPRPCLLSQSELIEARRNLGVLEMIPGITGLAQVRGVDMSTPERLAEVDAEYGRKASLVVDLSIMLQTLSGRGGGDRVGA